MKSSIPPKTVSEQITSNDIPEDVTKSSKPSTPSVTTQSPSLITWTVDETTAKKNISEDTVTTTEGNQYTYNQIEYSLAQSVFFDQNSFISSLE